MIGSLDCFCIMVSPQMNNIPGRFEEKQIPQKEIFYSRENLGDINEEDYENSLKIWKTFVLKKILVINIKTVA